MDVWPAGLSTGCFYQQSILSCLRTIKHGGFNSIEVCSSPSHLDYHDSADVIKAHGLIRELGMNVYSFHAPFAEYIDISSPRNPVGRNAMDEIYTAADAASLLGATYFVIHPGPEHGWNEDERRHIERLKHTTESLFRIAARCRRLGVRCVLEKRDT